MIGSLAHGLRERLSYGPQPEFQHRACERRQRRLINALRALAPYILRSSRDAERLWRDQCDDVFDVAVFHDAGHAEFHLDSGPAIKGVRVAHATTVRDSRANAMVDGG
jgi:hypothetical protein